MPKSRSFSHSKIERRDAAENRQRILEAADKLFEQNGVEKVSMNQIAVEAGIGAGTLYRRYRNKGELCLALIKDNAVMCFEEIDAYLEENETAPASERLKGMLRIFIHFRESKAQLLKGVEDGEPAKRSSSKRSPLYDELHHTLVGLFDEMKEVHSNTVFKADILLAALKSEEYLFQREVRGYSPEEILEQIYSLFIPEV
ncbi:TetR/AcrR family transcriptional regulator [Halobacillus salinarum]|uniref:TetR/AcrR family transcriptional regulator n=1 Tax=Halobacillus salinarum TaxID=2932257 RepID=A0ABY4EPR9_9BACI|nr:TetR/AcrR family transcriptional regulator [Halobacillus salinarum]UOQ45912.1 TetR/AcrR family transcriptional regulator [Halobacillus salinarum]